MQPDPQRLAANIRAATTEDLLDRATVYRQGMEESALELIDAELARRGVGRGRIEAHEQTREVLVGKQGLPRKCHRCPRPAIVLVWGWHRMWGLIPLFPRKFTLVRGTRTEPKSHYFALAACTTASTSAWLIRRDGLSSCMLNQLMTTGV